MRRRWIVFVLLSICWGHVGVAQVLDLDVEAILSAANQVMMEEDLPEDSLSQTAVIDDGLIAADTIVADSIADVDSLEVELVTTLPDNKAFIVSWCKRYPFGEVHSDALWNAAADSTHTALYQGLDTIPYDEAMHYAQMDMRLPVFVGGKVPDRLPTSIGALAQKKAKQCGELFPLLNNPFQDQLDYSNIVQNAVFAYTSRNLRKVKHFRPEHPDFDTERRLIERQQLSGDEHVDTDMGLKLESAELQLEKVTFHADKWHRRGTTELQVSQTALTDNWYKGGDNNMTIYNYDKLVFNRYDESKKTDLDIALELRLSGYYTKADTIHPMRVNDNQFRADITYGYKAWKDWYYSSSATIKTPIFEYFNANSKEVKNSFFSPLEFNLSVGMNWKYAKKKNCTYSLMLAPMSYNLKCVADHRVQVTPFGIEEGKRSLNQFGASITSKLEWKISDELKWTSRAYFFTSYHNTQLEFENTVETVLSRYSTAKIYLYPRFDDGVDQKLQMKEMLTFGLAFAW